MGLVTRPPRQRARWAPATAELDGLIITITPTADALAALGARKALRAVIDSDGPPSRAYVTAELARLATVVARFDTDAAAALDDLATR